MKLQHPWKPTGANFGSAALAVALLCGPHPASELRAPELAAAPAPGKAGATALPAALQPVVARTLAADAPQVWRAAPAGRDALGFHNPAQQLSARFDRRGARLRLDGERRGSVELRLVALHRGGVDRPVASGAPSYTGTRVEIPHGGGLTEWYLNSPLGVEQGFTFARAPSGDGPLALHLRLRGDLVPALRGAGLEFKDAEGRRVLRYGGLLAYDARQRELPARLALTGRDLYLTVDARGARYPVTVDPLFASLTSFAEPTAVAYDGFGESVALSGDGNTALVGVPGHSHIQGGVPVITTAGAAYVFTRTNGTWATTPSVTFTDPAATTGDEFGVSVALSGDGSIALVGAESVKDGSTGPYGAAYVYTQSHGIWSSTPSHSFIDPGTSADAFGFSVALSNDGSTAAIGAPSTNSSDGAAYVYTQSGGSWPTTPNGSFTDPLGTNGDGFGHAVALSGNGSSLLSGAPGTKAGSLPCCVGDAYVYTENHGTWPSLPSQSFANPQGTTAQAQFGSSVALSGDGTIALIGAEAGSSNATNAAYVFASSSGIWSGTAAHTFADPTTNTAENYGASVALSNDGSTALIGAPQTTVSGGAGAGAAYVYVQTSGSWSSTPTKALTDPPAAAGDDFGNGVALSDDGSTSFIGATYTMVSSLSGAGAAYSIAASADLSLQLASNPASTTPGQNVSYMATVTNNDTQVTATNLTLTDTLPTGTSFVSAAGAGGSCSEANGAVTCTLASLSAGADWKPSITVTAASAGSLKDTAAVTADQPDPNTSNNSATATTTVAAASGSSSGGGGGGGGGPVGIPALLLLGFGLALRRRRQ